MTNASVNCAEDFTELKIIETIACDMMKHIMHNAPREYGEALKNGKNFFFVGVNVSDKNVAIKASELIHLTSELKKRFPDAKEIKLEMGKSPTMDSFTLSFGAYIALNAQGISEMNDEIYKVNTPFIARVGRAFGLNIGKK